MTVSLKTIGAAPKEVMDFDSKKIADEIQYEIGGNSATEMQALQVTQDFIDKYEIKAKFHSGTFLGFKFSDEAEEEYETFKRK